MPLPTHQFVDPGQLFRPLETFHKTKCSPIPVHNRLTLSSSFAGSSPLFLQFRITTQDEAFSQLLVMLQDRGFSLQLRQAVRCGNWDRECKNNSASADEQIWTICMWTCEGAPLIRWRIHFIRNFMLLVFTERFTYDACGSVVSFFYQSCGSSSMVVVAAAVNIRSAIHKPLGPYGLWGAASQHNQPGVISIWRAPPSLSPQAHGIFEAVIHGVCWLQMAPVHGCVRIGGLDWTDLLAVGGRPPFRGTVPDNKTPSGQQQCREWIKNPYVLWWCGGA
jgi:hypothetical protein